MGLRKIIVIISPDLINEKMAGPGIRYWNIAHELSRYFDVKLFVPGGSTMLADFEILPIRKTLIQEYSRVANGIIIQGLMLWNHAYIKKIGVPIIVDLYDPFIFENMEVFNSYDDKNAHHKFTLSVLLDQLFHGDFFICASEKQKDFWLGMLTAINRINPIEYNISKSMDHLITVVPFGIPNEEPFKTKEVLKGVYPGISRSDKVLVWGGGVWDWLDPLTAIKAINIYRQYDDSIRLFFMGVHHPDSGRLRNKKVIDAISLSHCMGLTDKYVFFNDWVKYHERHNYLMEADIGISLHYNHIETRFSFRTRILDYIWCKLPVISTKGDVMSDLIENYELGITVQPENDQQVVDAIRQILSHPPKTENFKNIHKKLSWSVCVAPLINFCYNAEISKGKAQAMLVRGLDKNKYFYKLFKTLSLVKNGEIDILFKKIKNIRRYL